MAWTIKTILASLVIGILGAAIATFIIWIVTFATASHLIRETTRQFGISIGVVSGFITCFLFSIRYLKLMENKVWPQGIGYGILLGGVAGLITGFITSFGFTYGELYHKSYTTSRIIRSYLLGVAFASGWGAMAGVFTSFALTMIIGKITLPKIIRKNNSLP